MGFRLWLTALSAGVWLHSGCSSKSQPAPSGEPGLTQPSDSPAEPKTTSPYPRQRERTAMVDAQLAGRDLTDPIVLAAMKRVPRHRFVPEPIAHRAYEDNPLPIGKRQTISQPYIVGLMTELVKPRQGHKVLDVGTGSGYQAAVLAEIVDQVYGVEIVCDLADAASRRLTDLGYTNATIRCGDGYAGWKEHAPFDAIVVAAAPKQVPPPLLEQLKPGGKLVIPVGDRQQELRLYRKESDGTVSMKHVTPVRFVPFVRKAGDKEPR